MPCAVDSAPNLETQWAILKALTSCQVRMYKRLTSVCSVQDLSTTQSAVVEPTTAARQQQILTKILETWTKHETVMAVPSMDTNDQQTIVDRVLKHKMDTITNFAEVGNMLHHLLRFEFCFMHSFGG